MLEQLVDAFAHLARSLIGERDRQNRIRRHALLLDQVRDAIGNHARLARPGSGQDEYRAVRRFYGSSLLRIQLFDKMLQEIRVRKGKALTPVYRSRSRRVFHPCNP